MYFDAGSASFCATAPAVIAFHGLAFLRGGMIAFAPRSANGVMAVSGALGAVSCDAGNLLFCGDLGQ